MEFLGQEILVPEKKNSSWVFKIFWGELIRESGQNPKPLEFLYTRRPVLPHCNLTLMSVESLIWPATLESDPCHTWPREMEMRRIMELNLSKCWNSSEAQSCGPPANEELAGFAAPPVSPIRSQQTPLATLTATWGSSSSGVKILREHYDILTKENILIRK